MHTWSPLNKSPQTLKWMQQVLRRALPFPWSLLQSEGDAGLTFACPILKLDASPSLANAKFSLDSSLIFSILIANFDMIACSATWIVLVFAWLTNSASSMA